MKDQFLYVCEGINILSANPLIRVDTFEQADIVRKHLKKIMPEMIITYFATSDKVDVPHFSDYIWD